ncbi:MAG: hypothetical protein JXJ17_13315 [Anaerolineae bacterium]|nr:hypothetical protein [Anaerolineae bacterium]
MTQATLIVNRVLPILLLIGLGYWIHQRRFLSDTAIDDLRKIAVNIALPSVLFVSFLNIQMEPAYLLLFALTFVLCLTLLGLGSLLKRWLKIDHEYFPFLVTGFEYGMLGVSLFGAAYSLEAVGTIAVVDLGHEIFIWFVFLALLLKKRDDLQGVGQLARVFFQSPVVIAILLGILFNLLGLQAILTEGIVSGAIIAALNFLSNLTVPLILIIVGYGIKLSAEGLRESLLVTILRLGLLVPLAIAVNTLLIRGALGLGKPFEAAMFTLLVLPPPFIIPLYMRSGDEDERRYVNNVLALHTVVSLIIFTVYLILNPVI